MQTASPRTGLNALEHKGKKLRPAWFLQKPSCQFTHKIADLSTSKERMSTHPFPITTTLYHLHRDSIIRAFLTMLRNCSVLMQLSVSVVTSCCSSRANAFVFTNVLSKLRRISVGAAPEPSDPPIPGWQAREMSTEKGHPVLEPAIGKRRLPS